MGDVVEIMARGLAYADGADLSDPDINLAIFRFVASDVLLRLDAAGYAVVPKEP
jgi:hypothetical protein